MAPGPTETRENATFKHPTLQVPTHSDIGDAERHLAGLGQQQKSELPPGSKVPRTTELLYLELYPEAICNPSEIVLIQFLRVTYCKTGS